MKSMKFALVQYCIFYDDTKHWVYNQPFWITQCN